MTTSTKQRTITTSSKVTPPLKQQQQQRSILSPKKKKSPLSKRRTKSKSLSSPSSSSPNKGSSKRTLFHYFSPSAGGSTTRTSKSKSKLFSSSPSSSLKKLIKNKVSKNNRESPRSTIRSDSMGSTPSPTTTTTSTSKLNGVGNGTKDQEGKGNTNNSTRVSLAPLNSNILANGLRPQQQSSQHQQSQQLQQLHRSNNSSIDGKNHLNKVTLTPKKRVMEERPSSSSSIMSNTQCGSEDENKNVSIEPKRMKFFREELDQESEDKETTKHSSSSNRNHNSTPTRTAIRSSLTSTTTSSSTTKSSSTLPTTLSKKENVPCTPVSKTSLPSTNTNHDVTIMTPSQNHNSINNDLSVGLIRVKSSKATLQELCTCVYELLESNNNSSSGIGSSSNDDNNPTIYKLFDGAILGRNERSKKNPNKINIGIPTSEDGVSRNQLTTTILHGTDTLSDIAPPTFSGKEEISTSCEQTLHDYLSYHQANSPYVKVVCAKSASNPIVIVKALGNNGIQNEESSTTSNNMSNRRSVSSGDCVKLRGKILFVSRFVIPYQNNYILNSYTPCSCTLLYLHQLSG